MLRLTSIVALVLAFASACTKQKERTERDPATAAPTPPGAQQSTPVQAPTAIPVNIPGPTVAVAAPTGVLGAPAPDFQLRDLDGNQVALSSFKGKRVVLEWFNPECPFVKRSHGKGSLVALARKHTEAGVVWLAINSGGLGKQGQDLVVNKAAAKEWNLAHPILSDASGAIGRAYGATNTPHMFVIDAEGKLVYAGAIDNSPDGAGGSPTGGTLINHVDAALADLAAGRPVATPSTKAYGCSVKYGS